MSPMESAFWQRVVAQGLQVPADHPLPDLTAELTRMLADPDPTIRDEIAFPVLATWVSEGVYDDLLPALGDGMCAGLTVGLGESGTTSIYRRSFSALVLTECIDRDTEAGLVTADTVLRWGDHLTTWLLREQDLRGFVPGQGWAHAVAHGADALGALARSGHLGKEELAVVLDVVADRLLNATDTFFVAGEHDRLAFAVIHALRRDLLGQELLDPWVARLSASAAPSGSVDRHPYLVAGNVQAFLRSLQLQLALGVPQPAVRADLLLTLVGALRATNRDFFVMPHKH